MSYIDGVWTNLPEDKLQLTIHDMDFCISTDHCAVSTSIADTKIPTPIAKSRCYRPKPDVDMDEVNEELSKHGLDNDSYEEYFFVSPIKIEFAFQSSMAKIQQGNKSCAVTGLMMLNALYGGCC